MNKEEIEAKMIDINELSIKCLSCPDLLMRAPK